METGATPGLLHPDLVPTIRGCVKADSSLDRSWCYLLPSVAACVMTLRRS